MFLDKEGEQLDSDQSDTRRISTSKPGGALAMTSDSQIENPEIECSEQTVLIEYLLNT